MSSHADAKDRSRSRDEFSRALFDLGIEAKDMNRLEEIARAFERLEFQLVRQSAGSDSTDS